MGTQLGAPSAYAAKTNPLLDRLTGAGYVAYGLVYLLIGWLALQLVFGERERAVSKNGALKELAEQPLGNFLLWAACVGLATLAIRSGLDALLGHRQETGLKRAGKRLADVVRLGVFALLGVSSAKVAIGQASKENTDSYTAKVMQLPLGTWLVAGIGLAVIAYALFSIGKALSGGYEEELDLRATTGTMGTAVGFLARWGYVARGAAFGIIGALFVWAAVTHDADKSGGFDVALSRLLHAPLGPLLLGVVAAGLCSYGLYNIARARYHQD